MTAFLFHLLRIQLGFQSRLHLALTRPRDDRGDVPGWVMIAVMTAGLCTALYVIAKSQLTDLLSGALHDVTGGQ